MSAAVANYPPMYGVGRTVRVLIQGLEDEEGPRGTVFRAVTPRYFETLGIPILRGRTFVHSDSVGGEQVVIVDRILADRFFSSEDPIGREIIVNESRVHGDVVRRIVGIASDTKQQALIDEAEGWNGGVVYIPHAQGATQYVDYQVGFRGNLAIFSRRSGDPGVLARPVEEVIRLVDRQQPIRRIGTLRKLIEETDAVSCCSMKPLRLHLALLSVFALFGLTTVSIGPYSAVSYVVEQRTQEIGTRMAH
ncbi:MAG: ABC transporter permease [Acidobacteria bacterium]|nr:ABC transporter permease [Acidobacteriota bacterium]